MSDTSPRILSVARRARVPTIEPVLSRALIHIDSTAARRVRPSAANRCPLSGANCDGRFWVSLAGPVRQERAESGGSGWRPLSGLRVDDRAYGALLPKQVSDYFCW